VAISGWKSMSKEIGKDRRTQFGTIPSLIALKSLFTDKCMLRVVTSRKSYEIEVNNWDLYEMVQDGPIFL